MVVQEREEIKYHILYQLLGVADNGCAYGTAVVGQRLEAARGIIINRLTLLEFVTRRGCTKS